MKKSKPGDDPKRHAPTLRTWSRLMQELMVTPVNELNRYRSRRIGLHSEVDLKHIQHTRELLLFLGERISLSEPKAWKQLDELWHYLRGSGIFQKQEEPGETKDKRASNTKDDEVVMPMEDAASSPPNAKLDPQTPPPKEETQTATPVAVRPMPSSEVGGPRLPSALNPLVDSNADANAANAPSPWARAEPLAMPAQIPSPQADAPPATIPDFAETANVAPPGPTTSPAQTLPFRPSTSEGAVVQAVPPGEVSTSEKGATMPVGDNRMAEMVRKASHPLPFPAAEKTNTGHEKGKQASASASSSSAAEAKTAIQPAGGSKGATLPVGENNMAELLRNAIEPLPFQKGAQDASAKDLSSPRTSANTTKQGRAYEVTTELNDEAVAAAQQAVRSLKEREK